MLEDVNIYMVSMVPLRSSFSVTALVYSSLAIFRQSHQGYPRTKAVEHSQLHKTS